MVKVGRKLKDAALIADTSDYVVVGGGTAGCIVAARLSEDPAVRVTLLEAGPPDRDPWIHIPAGYARLSKSRRYDWGYATEPEPELDGRTVAWPRGKVLGGSGSVNGLVFLRGSPHDYDRWAQAERGAGRGTTCCRPPPDRAVGGRAGWHARDGRAHSCQRATGAVGGGGGVPCRLPGCRVRAAPGHQRRPTGGRRRRPDERAGRPARQHGTGLSAPGAQPAEPAGHDRGVRAACDVRRVPPRRRVSRPCCRMGRLPSSVPRERSCCAAAPSRARICCCFRA